jgi:hypothetical protein
MAVAVPIWRFVSLTRFRTENLSRRTRLAVPRTMADSLSRGAVRDGRVQPGHLSGSRRLPVISSYISTRGDGLSCAVGRRG